MDREHYVMIKTIIFDIGNVLVDFAWEPFYKSFGFKEEIFERLANATVRSDVWNELDRGEWSMEKIIDAFIANDPGIEEEIRRVFQDTGNILVKREYAIPWIHHLRKLGYQVLYLSNMGEDTHIKCKEALAFMEHMDGGVLSYEFKIVKPDVRIYQALIEKYNVIPEESVFVDDTLKNVIAARELGFCAIHATSHAEVLGEFEKIGIAPYSL